MDHLICVNETPKKLRQLVLPSKIYHARRPKVQIFLNDNEEAAAYYAPYFCSISKKLWSKELCM